MNERSYFNLLQMLVMQCQQATEHLQEIIAVEGIEAGRAELQAEYDQRANTVLGGRNRPATYDFTDALVLISLMFAGLNCDLDLEGVEISEINEGKFEIIDGKGHTWIANDSTRIH